MLQARAFGNGRKPENGRPPEIMESATGEAMTNLVRLRARDYPPEQPIDGATLTTSARTGTPRYADLGVRHEEMKTCAAFSGA